MDLILNKRTQKMLGTLRFSGGMVYLFRGEKGMGRMTYARRASAQFLGVSEEKLHAQPDYYEISTEGRLGVGDLTDLREFAGYLPVDAVCKVAVIDAASLTEEAQASLLKLLEDGATHVAFILITSGRVLATIESRSRVIDFLAVPDERMVVLGEPEIARKLAAGRPGVFYELTKSEHVPYLDACQKAVEACLLFDKAGLLQSLHLVKEKDKEAFFEAYGRDLSALFLRYLSTCVQDALVCSEDDDDTRRVCAMRKMLVLCSFEYAHLKEAVSYTKNDFFEFVRCLGACFS